MSCYKLLTDKRDFWVMYFNLLSTFVSCHHLDQSQGKYIKACKRGQRSSLVAHWLSVTGDHGSNPVRGEHFSIYLRIIS